MSQSTDLEIVPIKEDLREALIQVIKVTKPDPFYTRIFNAIIEAVRDDDDQTSNCLSMVIEAVEERARSEAYDWGFEAGYEQAKRELNAIK